MLAAEEVKQAITDEAKHAGKPRQKIESKALGYANEIASDQSYRVIRFFHVLLTWLWNNLYEGIDVNKVESAQELAKTYEIVYIPCHQQPHRLLAAVLRSVPQRFNSAAYRSRQEPCPLAGPLLRRAGAFYAPQLSGRCSV